MRHDACPVDVRVVNVIADAPVVLAVMNHEARRQLTAQDGPLYYCPQILREAAAWEWPRYVSHNLVVVILHARDHFAEKSKSEGWITPGRDRRS